MKSLDAAKDKLRGTYIVVLIPLGAAINLIGGQVAERFRLPLFLDSIGTTIVAAIMGPFVGTASGVLFNFISAIIGGNLLSSLFGICNIVMPKNKS